MDSWLNTSVFAIDGHVVALGCDYRAFSVDSLILGQAVLDLLISWVYKSLGKHSVIGNATLRRLASFLRKLSASLDRNGGTSLMRSNTHRGWAVEVV